jgi:hypothetical protein
MELFNSESFVLGWTSITRKEYQAIQLQGMKNAVIGNVELCGSR